LDWNWLFSSVAQSVAAIVGIFGAFVITTLTGNQSEFSRKRARTADLLAESDRLADSAESRYFAWYNKRTLKNALQSFRENLKTEDEFRSASEYYLEYSFPEFMEKEEVLAEIDATVETERRRRQARKNPTEHPTSPGGLRSLMSLPSIPQIPGAREILSENSLRQEYEQEREAINRLVVEVRHHVRVVSSHARTLENNPERSSAITLSVVAILLLFWTGVIYPLSFLPVGIGDAPHLSFAAFFEILVSLKGVVLSLATFLFSSLMLALGFLNRRLRYDPAEVQSLQARTKFGFYSPYLGNTVKNETALNTSGPPKPPA
jgi:hypothetical protein